MFVRETCHCDDLPAFTRLTNIFCTLKEPNGLQKMAKEIRKTKMDFRGRRIFISPTMVIKLGWDSRLRLFFSSFIFRQAHESLIAAFVSLFHPFMALHNFTFELVPDYVYHEGRDMVKKTVNISMLSSIHFTPAVQFEETYMYPVSLQRYSYYRTLFFSKTTTSDPSRLSSLAAPFSESAAAFILLSLSACAAISVLLLTAKSWDVVTAVLIIVSGLLGKTVNLSGGSWLFLWFYTIWLFLVGFIAMTYTNILQSVVVVPGFRSNSLTFEEMVAGNFTFVSTEWMWMKNVAKMVNATQRSPVLRNKTTSIT